ncbi:MAG: pyridoxamine 5'-phosphate oxidase family protein [Olsenella sp.]|nr:pyridoxamine 5'-phosphate oxidase family protein [Olsenella sp.]
MRRADREIKDLSEIKRIIGVAKIVHLGLVDGGRPYVVPLHYGFNLSEEALTLYMHGAKEGRKLDAIRANGAAFVELECDVDLVSGGDVPCRYGSYYASVMGEGEAIVVSDEREKIRGIELLMRNQTQRDFEVTPAMASAVTVIKVVVPMDSLTAKGRLMPR